MKLLQTEGVSNLRGGKSVVVGDDRAPRSQTTGVLTDPLASEQTSVLHVERSTAGIGGIRSLPFICIL